MEPHRPLSRLWPPRGVLHRAVRRVRAALRVGSPPDSSPYGQLREAFHRTEGWCDPLSLPVWDAMLIHQRAAGVRGHLLEIGVYRGKSAALLAAHLDPGAERLFLVDPTMDAEAVRQTLVRVRPAADRALVFVLEPSARVLDGQAGAARGQFRWIHIDGSHAFACVSEDLASAHELLAEDGVVVLDDFFSIEYPHLTEAVFRYLAQNPTHFSLFLLAGRKGYLARPRGAPHYRHYCLESLVADVEARDGAMALWKTGAPGELDCFALRPREPSGQRLRGVDAQPHVIHTDARPWAPRLPPGVASPRGGA
jgi:hypothetical protein